MEIVTMPAPDPDPLLAAAREWFDAGFCVIPAHEDQSKRPFGPWKSYQRQRPDWDVLAGWLETGRYTGIGVLCGEASGSAELIEIEGPMAAAVERLGRVIAKARDFDSIGVPDLLGQIARGCVEQSAGGGLHLFIRVSNGPALGNTQLAHVGQKPERKVISETRGEGGFVIVAPTPGRRGHAPGASYLFINGGHPSRTVDVTAEERDILHTLFTLALDEPEDVDDTPTPTARVTGPSDYSGESAFDAYRDAVTWADILIPAGWTWSHRDNERDYWTRPGKDKAEGHSASTIEDGPLVNFSSSVDLAVKVGYSKPAIYAHLHHGDDLSKAARALMEDGYGTPPTRIDLPAWEGGLDPDATEEERAEAQKSWVEENLPRLDWHGLWADDAVEEWIVEPLLAARRLVALYSAPKVGKSLLMLELAAGIATGKALLGNPPCRPRRTLYVDYENDPRGDIRERLINMGYGPGDLDNLVLLSFPTMAALDSEAGSLQLIAAIDEYECEIVVIDTVSRAIAGDENENDTWLNFYRHTGLKLKQRGVALIRLDHSGKDEAKGQRGGSAKSGDVDAVWRMSRAGEETFDLVCEAQRFPIAEKRLTIRRVEDPVLMHRVEADGRKAKRDELLDALTEARVPKDLAGSIRTLRSTLRKDYSVTFANVDLTPEAWSQYCSRPVSWTPETMPVERSE